jgi:sugar/nucleoside kinase (ribokinase family)
MVFVAKKRFDILVVGELNPDLILSGNVVPEFRQVEKLVDDAVLTIGGSSGIFACAVAKLGLSVAIVGRVGNDEFGHFMVHSLQNKGIDTTGVIVDSEIHTGLSVILARGDDRAILTFPGTIPFLSFKEIQPELMMQSRHLHLACYYLQNALRPDVTALFALAHEIGLSVSLDTNYDPMGTWDGGIKEVLKRTDIFLPNETECCAIAGIPDVDMAMKVLAEHIPIVAVKKGTRGASMMTSSKPGRVFQSESIPVNVEDTVGAGDSFDAGFLYGYLSNWDLEQALRLGTICGSLSTRKAGGTNAQPTLEEAKRYIL